MKKLLLVTLFALAFAVCVAGDRPPDSSDGDPVMTPDPRRVIWMSTLEEFIAVQDSHAGVSFDTLNREDCEKALKHRDTRPGTADSDTPVLAYGTAYYELSPGMSAEDALAVFARHHLEKQNWTKEGSASEWWNWKWRAPQDDQKRRVLSVSLDVEFRDDKVKRIVFDLGSSEGSLHCLSGSLEK